MTYAVWVDQQWLDVSVPEMSGEPLVVPNVAAIVLSVDRDKMLLQRRDKPGEPVRGRLEVPGGRWGAGEAPERAVAREVRDAAVLSWSNLPPGPGGSRSPRIDRAAMPVRWPW